jgi:hypothetical protein
MLECPINKLNSKSKNNEYVMVRPVILIKHAHVNRGLTDRYFTILWVYYRNLILSLYTLGSVGYYQKSVLVFNQQ